MTVGRKHLLLIAFLALFFIQCSNKFSKVQTINQYNQTSGDNNSTTSRKVQSQDTAKEGLPFVVGEKIIYDVYFKEMRIGHSSLQFNGVKKLKAGNFYEIIFYTEVTGFKDKETIYAYRGSFLPFKVIRDIHKMGLFPLDITEIYNQKKHEVKIKKQGRFLSKEHTISSQAPIYNPILLVYYYRSKEHIKSKKPQFINLATNNFTIVFQGVEKITTPIGQYPAYVFADEQGRFKFWLSADKRRIPLKIESFNSFGYSLEARSVILED
jgi:hypothetical protein